LGSVDVRSRIHRLLALTRLAILLGNFGIRFPCTC